MLVMGEKTPILAITIVATFLVLTTYISDSSSQTTITVDPFSDEFVIVSHNTLPGGKFFYLPSNSDGTFGSPTFIADTGTRISSGIGDFDNDRDLDFILGAIQTSCSFAGKCVSFFLFQNIGGGSFVQTLIEEDIPAGPTSDNSPVGLAIADFNQDGYNDFVSGIYRSNFVYLFTNNQDNTFTRSQLQSLPNPTDAEAGDFNEDGNMDFLIAEYFASSVHLYEGDGTGSFTKKFLFTVPGPRAASLSVGDYNEDGHLDVIVDSLHDFTARMYFGDGMGNFVLNGIVYTRSSQTYVDSFDFDKDGHSDVLISDWASFVGNVYIKKGNGDGTFEPESVVASSLSTFLIVSAPPLEDPCIILTKNSQTIQGTLNCNEFANDLHVVFKGNAKMQFSTDGKTVSHEISKPKRTNDFEVTFNPETCEISSLTWTKKGEPISDSVVPPDVNDFWFVAKSIVKVEWTLDGTVIDEVQLPKGKITDLHFDCLP